MRHAQKTLQRKKKPSEALSVSLNHEGFGGGEGVVVVARLHLLFTCMHSLLSWTPWITPRGPFHYLTHETMGCLRMKDVTTEILHLTVLSMYGYAGI